MSHPVYECDRYLCKSVDEVKKMLEKYGVAILPSVLDGEECKKMLNGMWDYLEHVSSEFPIPIKRDDEKTWKEIKHLWPKHQMLLQHFGIGHCQMVWDLRQKEKILNVFSKIWDTKKEDLVTSFDGASFHLVENKKPYKGWLHSDQCFLRNRFECVQSWVTALEVQEGDATLEFLEGSHAKHADFKKWKNDDALFKKAGDWYKLEEDDLKFYLEKEKCQHRAIKCPAGSMVFWDSRTIHSGLEPAKERKELRKRCVAYLCYTPRKLASAAMLKKKVKAFEELRTTNHWPHKQKLFPVLPRTYGAPIQKIKKIEKPIGIGEIGKRLIGY